ncbi:MAG TPA: cyclic nucleotide-binding domain-containing protein [Verrucomicrobiae bacterium]|nr:cyclic nucleotide-binding domain-containing protein [Verrucomicrobiae bacterium]
MRAMLQNVPIFAGLDAPALDLLWERALELRVDAGKLVVREGEVGNRLYLVGSGSVKVCKHLGEAHEVELAHFGPTDFFGEMCILETLPRCASVLAVTDAVLYSLSSLTFLHLYEVMPSQYSILLLNIARDLSRRLRHVDEVFASRH